MRRCECTVWPPSVRMSRCFPRETASVTVLPVRSAAANRGTRKSLRVSTRPASAPCSWRAARQTTSPSGICPAFQAAVAQRDVEAAGRQPRFWPAGARQGSRHPVVGEPGRPAEDEQVA